MGRKHVATLIARMGIEAIHRKPGTSKKHPGQVIYPYLLRNLTIDQANQVRALDTTYIPMKRGFVYTGWVTDEDPAVRAARKINELDYQPPLDIVDGAARNCDQCF